MTGARAIAAAQTVPLRGDVSANLAQHVRLAQLAAEGQAKVLVFPELSLTGYELTLAARLSFSENDARLEPLVEVAASSSLTLVVGAPIRIAERLHIGAFVISPDRTLRIHTKAQLGAFSRDVSPDGIVPPAEDSIFVPGDLAPLIRFGDDTAAIAICSESLQPSIAKQAAERGANTYLAAHFAIPSDLELRMKALRAYATRYRMAVVFASYGGATGGLPAGGGSAVWSDSGELLVQLAPSGAGVAIALESERGFRTKTVMLT